MKKPGVHVDFCGSCFMRFTDTTAERSANKLAAHLRICAKAAEGK